MKVTEIIEKVKQNLKIQEDLKSQLENDEAKREILQEKIAYTQEKLIDAEQNEEVLKENLIQDLKEGADALKPSVTLQERFAYPNDNMFGYGINFNFLGKNYEILSYDYDLMSDVRIADVSFFADKVMEDYMTKGNVLFNDSTLKSLKDIKKIYEIKPEVITEKLVSMRMDKEVKKLKSQLDMYRQILNNDVSELSSIDAKIAKTKEFKSEFLKKIFTKKAKLEEKRAVILNANEENNNIIDNLESRLAEKSKIRESASEYVQKALVSLSDIFAWVDSFETSRKELAKYKVEYIETLKREVEDLEEDYANTQTQIKETKGLLQLNKKVNNEIVDNALMNSYFVEDWKLVDSGNVTKANAAAVKFVENKYHNYLQNCVEKAVR